MSMTVTIDWRLAAVIGGTVLGGIALYKLDSAAVKDVLIVMIDSFKERSLAAKAL